MELALEPAAPSSGAARRWVSERLRELGLDELGESVTLLTSEVVTNAVLHAATPLTLRMVPEGGGVRVEVRDGSAAPPTRRRHPSTSTVGRGLAMLDSLADEWGWRRDGVGKLVWFRVEQARDPEPAPEAFDLDEFDPQASGLGRYTPDGGQDGAAVRITLQGLPLRLLLAGQEHHDGLLRELRLLALSEEDSGGRPPDPRLRGLVDALGRQYAAARARRDEEIEAAMARGETTIDQVFSVPPTAGSAMQGLATLLSEADRLCEDNVLMTPPRPALLRRFADWYLGEVLAQSAGRPPRPWDGPPDLPAGTF